MSNVKRSYNTSRRIRKGYEKRLNRLMLMRPLRSKTKVLADEYITESPNLYYFLAYLITISLSLISLDVVKGSVRSSKTSSHASTACWLETLAILIYI